MSGLETLPPDQRAVLQLILQQGRGYDELAGMLKLDPAAVRGRAHAGLDALAAAAPSLSAEQRAQIADYLLGQQDEGQRIVTLAELGGSPDAAAWALALHVHLAQLAPDALPPVPSAPAASNGTAAPPRAAVQPPAPEPAAAAPVPQTSSPAQPPTTELAPPAAPAPSSSRLSGAVLLALGAALVVVLAIVLIGGGDDDGGTAASTPPATTQPSTTGSQGTTNPPVASLALLPTDEASDALAAGLVQRVQGQLVLAMQAEKVPANVGDEFYGLWLRGSAGTTFLGFVPNQVRADGVFSVTSQLPDDLRAYSTMLVTREAGTGSSPPDKPGPTVLSGPLRFS